MQITEILRKSMAILNRGKNMDTLIHLDQCGYVV